MAVEMFLKIGDITGESQEAKHKDHRDGVDVGPCAVRNKTVVLRC